MENETEYFSTTIANSPTSDLEREVTILVDEDGEMVLDITQTLSSIEQSEEGSVVIITTDQSNTLNDSVVTYNVLSEESRKTPLSFQQGDTFIVQNSPSPNTSPFNDKRSPVSTINKVNNSTVILWLFQLTTKNVFIN